MGVKLEDIANKLNTSVVTVSNALAGRKGVSDELREEIKTAAEEMGYKRREPKKNGSAGIEKRGRRVGVLTYDRHISEYSSFYWEMYQRTVFRASKNGCVAMLEIFTEEMQDRLTLPSLLKGRPDGIIVLGQMETEYLHRVIASAKVPVVLLDFECEEADCDAVLSNNFYGMYAMTNYLIREGHTRVAYVGNILATGSIMDRYQGYCKSLIEHGLSERGDWIISDRDIETGNIDITELPADMPTAFVCNSDYTAEILINKLTVEGYRVPEDISVVSYDDYVPGGPLKDYLTTYSVDMDSMANRALKLLMSRMNGEARPKRVYTVDGNVVIRKSVKKLTERD